MESKKQKLLSYISIIGFISFCASSYFFYGLVNNSFEKAFKTQKEIQTVESAISSFHREMKHFVDNPESTHSLKVIKTDLNRLKKVKRTVDSYVTDNNPMPFDITREVLLKENGRFIDNVSHYMNISSLYLKKVESGQSLSRYEKKQLRITYIKIVNEVNELTTELNKIAQKRLDYLKYCLMGFFSLAGMMMYFMHLNIFAPWLREFRIMKHQSEKLKAIMRETEESGKTYSWELDLDSKVIVRSEQLSNLFEINMVEGESEYIYDELSYMTDNSSEAFNRAIENCEKDKGSFEVEVKVVTKSKKTYWFQYSCFYSDDHGRKIVGTVKDISALKLSRSRFNKIFEENKFPLILVSDNSIKKINKACLQYLEYESAEDLISLNPNIFSPLYQENNISSNDKLKELFTLSDKGNAIASRWTFTTKHGPLKEAKIQVYPLDSSHKKSHIIMINDSIDTIKLEDRLNQQLREHQMTLRKCSELINNLYFESVNTLTNSITEIENSKIEGKELLIKSFNKKIDDINKITITELIDSNVNESKVMPVFSFLTETVNQWKKQNVHLDLEVDIQSEYLGEHYLWGRPILFTNIVLNTLNGIKEIFSEGKIVISYEILNYDSDNVVLPIQLKFMIVNQGIDKDAIDELLQKQSFNPFHQEDSMYIQRAVQIIEDDGGQMGIRSINGVGTTFELSLPFERVVREKGEEAQLQISPIPKTQETGFEKVSNSEILKHFSGEWDILQTLSQDILNYIPIAIKELDEAISEKNPQLLYTVACSLYGVFSHLPVHHILVKCITLQKHGQYKSFDGVDSVVILLKKDLEEISENLGAVAKKSVKLAA